MCVITIGVRRLARLTAALALGLGACATGSRPPEAAGTPVHCAGGTVTSRSGAAAYRACNVINGDLRVLDTDLTDLSALAKLHRVSGSLVIAGNAKLSDLHGLEALRSAGALVIRDNAGLHTTLGLSSLTEVGDLVVARNATLISLGIDSLKRARSRVATVPVEPGHGAAF